jgi:hypothetical protein
VLWAVRSRLFERSREGGHPLRRQSISVEQNEQGEIRVTDIVSGFFNHVIIPIDQFPRDASFILGELDLQPGRYSIWAKLYTEQSHEGPVKILFRLQAGNDFDEVVLPLLGVPVALNVVHRFIQPGGTPFLKCKNIAFDPVALTLGFIKMTAIRGDSLINERLSPRTS